MIESRPDRLLVLLSALIVVTCAQREALRPMGRADVRPLGAPIKLSAAPGLCVIEHSFGGRERILVNSAYAILAQSDPDSLERIRQELSAEGERPASFVWEGLVGNLGDRMAEDVYVRIRFAGGFRDSAYVLGHDILPNETARYSVYSVGGRVDRLYLLWSGMEDSGG